MSRIDEFRHPYGLGGGTYLTGSASVSGSGQYFFLYMPITRSVATIFTGNISSGSSILNTFEAGIPIYAQITAVSQSSGAAFVYSALKDTNDL